MTATERELLGQKHDALIERYYQEDDPAKAQEQLRKDEERRLIK